MRLHNDALKGDCWRWSLPTLVLIKLQNRTGERSMCHRKLADSWQVTRNSRPSLRPILKISFSGERLSYPYPAGGIEVAGWPASIRQEMRCGKFAFMKRDRNCVSSDDLRNPTSSLL